MPAGANRLSPAAGLDASGRASPAKRSPCRTVVQSSRRQEYRAANAEGLDLETRALFAGSQGGTVARARGNTLVGHATRAWDRALRLGEQACYRLRSAIGASWNAASCSRPLSAQTAEGYRVGIGREPRIAKPGSSISTGGRRTGPSSAP